MTTIPPQMQAAQPIPGFPVMMGAPQMMQPGFPMQGGMMMGGAFPGVPQQIRPPMGYYGAQPQPQYDFLGQF